MTALEQQAVAALKAIVEEVAGHNPPFSADSYLPAHMIHDARIAIDESAGEDSPEQIQWRAHEQILLNRLKQADEMIKFLRKKNSELAQRVQFYEGRSAE